MTNVPLRFDIFSPFDGQKAVDVDLRRQVVARGLEHAGPEQRMEVRDVLADEVVDFRTRRLPPIVELLALLGFAPLLRCEAM